MTFLPDYHWPIPEAFKESLSAKRFQIGDTFYDHRASYEMPWGEALAHISRVAQIKSADALAVHVSISRVSAGKLQPATTHQFPVDAFIDLLRRG